jgi:hypothetical protein
MSPGGRKCCGSDIKDREWKSCIYANEFLNVRRDLVLDLVVKHRSIISSNHRLFTPDIPLDQFPIQIISVRLALMQL